MIIIYIFEYSPAGFLHDRDDRIVRRDRDRKPAWAFHTAGKKSCQLENVFCKVFCRKSFMSCTWKKNNQWIVMIKTLSRPLTKLLHTLKPVKFISKLFILSTNWPPANLVDLNCNKKVTACTPNPLSCGGTGGCYGSIPQLGYTYIQVGFDIYGPLMSSSSSSSSLSSFFPSPSPFTIIIITKTTISMFILNASECDYPNNIILTAMIITNNCHHHQ